MKQQMEPNEEVDLFEFFNAIGKLINKIAKGILSILESIFFLLLKFLLFIKKNILYLGLGVLVGIIMAFIFENNYQTQYKSNIFIKTNYQSQPALEGKIESLNSLIDGENYTQLSQELGLSEQDAKELISFYIKPVYSDILLLKEYDQYMSALDTSSHKFLKFPDYKKEMKKTNSFSPYNEITVKAYSPHIFSVLNSYFSSILEDEKLLKERKESKVHYLKHKINLINHSLEEIDSLRQVLNKVYAESASKQSSGGVVINNADSKGPEKPYDLFNQRMKLLKELKKTKRRLTEEKQIVMLLNTFPKEGTKESVLTYNPYIQYPLYGFIAVLLILVLLQLNKILKDYQKKLEKNEID